MVSKKEQEVLDAMRAGKKVTVKKPAAVAPAPKSKADLEMDDIENKLFKKKPVKAVAETTPKSVKAKPKTQREIEISKITKIVAPNVVSEGPEWKTIEVVEVYYKINWVGILRSLNSFGKNFNIIGKSKKEKEIYHGLWEKYCNWWNLKVNKIDPNENLYEEMI